MRFFAGKRCRYLTSIALGGVVILLTGCFLTGGNYLIVKDRGEVAIVSFALDRSVNAVGDSSIDHGAGLLNSKEEKETYWDDHQEVVDALYELYKENISKALLGAPVLDPQKVAASNEYLKLTEYKPKVVMGKDIAPGWNQIPAAGTNYVSPYDKEKMEKLCEIFDVDLLVTVTNKASFDVLDSVRVEPDGFGTRHIPLGFAVLETDMYLYEKGNGIVWSGTYRDLNSENIVDLRRGGGEITMYKKDYTPEFSKAFGKVFERIMADARRGEKHLEEQAAEQES
ncbi:MAG: hypothetical protein ACLFQB_11075 [Chitinispirillaceae bacterium]